ncbi:MAG TPA: isovaleryl-CoA dehydrogenase [Bryobacteraceae bacterium]|nr:isovaleryl-CoA dehydrogenase [Bryobacteraceae bacterium]
MRVNPLASFGQNQPPPLVDYNVFETDRTLVEAVRREGAGWAEDHLLRFGAITGSERVARWGFQANENPPVLKTHDRYGNRIDEVEFHPSWHELMRLAIAHELHSLPWTDSREGAHVARAALVMVATQNEAGHVCPVSMTYSSIPALRAAPDAGRWWEARILSTIYDPASRPAWDKTGVTIGMAMTERQGGSDVRANTTQAERVSASEYVLTGQKWFCSAPMCDAFLVLAQAPGGLTCFLLPRWAPDGRRNGFHLERLKDKLGNRSNASAEVELRRAWARRVGEEGRGVPAIIEMVQHTRLDCVISSAGLMRQAVLQALHHACHRSAFGRLLIDQPVMRNVLADLVLESQAATLLAMRLAGAFDRRERDSTQRAFARMATPVAKYWICQRAPVLVGEALECLGGNGYIEEYILPRLYREAPLNSIWEGSGNVICLDALRAARKEPECSAALIEQIRSARGGHRHLDAELASLEAELPKDQDELNARRMIERLALALEASLMIQHADSAVSDAFCQSRLGRDWGRTFGTLPVSSNLTSIVNQWSTGS